MKKASLNTKNISYKDIQYIVFAAMSVLSFTIVLLIFGQTLLAGILITIVVLAGIVVVRKNVALNKKYEASITSMLKNYEKKNKIITEFSRKIREPLNNLIINEDILTESNLTPEQKEFAETVKASAKSMISVVNELTMAVAENANFDSKKQIQFNIGSTIEHVIELYSARTKSDLVFSFSKADEANLECVGDPIIIKQIFLDIFSRIENQSCDRQITINIGLNPVTESGSENIITFRIETNIKMPLIDETDLEGSRPANLISIMKGKYIQEVGDNSVMITILVRIKKAVSSSKGKALSKIDELMNKSKKPKDLKELKVLLVEDNMINSRIVVLTLKPLVQSIDLAYDGKEALDKFATSAYDLILMDIEMPVIDGLTATEKIRTLEATTNRHVPIIALTANAMIGDKERCLSAGADDYISKPFQLEQLVEKIKQIV